MKTNLPQILIIDEATEIDIIAFKKFIEKRPAMRVRGKWVPQDRSPVMKTTWLPLIEVDYKTD